MVFDVVHRIQLHKDDADDERAKMIELENGDSVTIECSADESYLPSSIMLLHNELNDSNAHQLLKNDRRVTLRIAKFNEETHRGSYLCAASSSDSHRIVERTIIVKRKARLNDLHYAMKCKENRCRNGGQCFVPLSGDRASFCLCSDEYAGKDCESHAVSSYAIQGTKATFGLGGICTSALIVLCILVAILYRREKRKRKELEAKFDELFPSYNNKHGQHFNFYDRTKMSESGFMVALKKPVGFSNSVNSEASVPFARIESYAEFETMTDDDDYDEQRISANDNDEPLQQKNRHVRRGRLNGTSDSVTTESDEATPTFK